MKRWQDTVAGAPLAAARRRRVMGRVLEFGAAVAVALGAQLVAIPEVCRESALRGVLAVLLPGGSSM